MPDLLNRGICVSNWSRRLGGTILFLPQPSLNASKQWFLAIRSMAAVDVATSDFSRAVVRIVRRCGTAIAEHDIEEYHELIDRWGFEPRREWDLVRIGLSEKAPRGSFLDNARRLDKRGRTDAALDLIFDQIDEMLLAGKFAAVD